MNVTDRDCARTTSIDNVRFLDKIDSSMAHLLLFHEDICTNLNNIMILVAYDDRTRVVGIVDWEGARVLPILLSGVRGS
jgi:hypothetical protein